jgi:hypothetical protein
MSQGQPQTPQRSGLRYPVGSLSASARLSRDGFHGVVVFGLNGMTARNRGVSRSAKDVVLESMGALEKLSALKLWWWLKREGGTVLKNVLGEKGTSVLALVGMLMLTWIGAEQTGQVDLVTPDIEAKVAMFVAFMQSLGLFGARDPGKKS